MAEAPRTTTPNFRDTVDQAVFIEPLGGPQHPQNYLDRFPDEVYNKGIDSHLVKFMYTLLGPAGIGWLRKNYLDARLKLEEYGLELFDLDAFYADPLRFARTLEAQYTEDPTGLLTREQWEAIRSKDAAYRARCLDYVRGMRAGNTPLGIRLAARSGLGHEVEVVENYRALYDQFMDDPIGLDYLGSTLSTEEFIVLPRRELAQSEIQRLYITGVPTAGTLTLRYRAKSTIDLAYNASRETIREALAAISEIGAGNIDVKGGPLPIKPVDIIFQNDLANRDTPSIEVVHDMTGENVNAFIETIRGGHDGTDEFGSIGPSDQRHLQSALDHLRPQTSVVSYRKASGAQHQVPWNKTTSTSYYTEVVRYALGQPNIPWPVRDSTHWIEGGIEHEGRRVHSDRQHHYAGFHNVVQSWAYTDDIIDSDEENGDYLASTEILTRETRNEHIGSYTNYQAVLFPFLRNHTGSVPMSSDMAMADYAEPLTVTTQSDTATLINGIYPLDYQNLAGVPQIRYRNEQFWSSLERADGEDYLELDLGSVKAVNYLTFEISRKPVRIDVSYDLLDQAPLRRFMPVVFRDDLPSVTSVFYSPGAQNPWEPITLNFLGRDGHMIFTRNIRVCFTHRFDVDSPFLNEGGKIPYSVEVRNLRIGRVVSP